MPARITRVELKNYKSFRHCDVSLENVTFLIGPNSAGKSNFLDALKFVSDALLQPLNHVLEARGGIPIVFHRSTSGQADRIRIRLTFEVGSHSYVYGFSLVSTPQGYCHFEDEFCEMDGCRMKMAEGAPLRADRLQLPYFAAGENGRAPMEFLAGMHFYSPEPQRLRGGMPVGGGRILNRDASNLGDVLKRIQEESPEAAERIRQYLTAIVPGLKSAEVVSYRNTANFLIFDRLCGTEDMATTNEQASDGTLRALAILVALFQTSLKNPQVTVIGVEEPENSLHPAASGVLFEAMQEAGASAQILVTTHSADLLDRKEAASDSILAVEMKDGETIIGPIDDASKGVVRRKLYTVGELMRINQIAPQVEPACP